MDGLRATRQRKGLGRSRFFFKDGSNVRWKCREMIGACNEKRGTVQVPGQRKVRLDLMKTPPNDVAERVFLPVHHSRLQRKEKIVKLQR